MGDVKLILLDVDGTLTVDRGTTALDPEAIRAIQEAHGRVRMGLVTGNALIVADALARYIGLGEDAPIIAENGCILKIGGNVVMLSSTSAKQVAEAVMSRLNLRPTYQYPCRYIDITLDVVGDNYDVVKRVREVLANMGYDGRFVVEVSGYAVHIRPIECSKPEAIRRLCSIMGVECSEVAFIGDSDMDAEAFKVVGLGVAVANATERARRAAALVTREPSGRGVAEFIRMILKGQVSYKSP